jgi:hypothetical protein
MIPTEYNSRLGGAGRQDKTQLAHRNGPKSLVLKQNLHSARESVLLKARLF